MSRKWAPSAAVWGAGAGVMVLYVRVPSGEPDIHNR